MNLNNALYILTNDFNITDNLTNLNKSMIRPKQILFYYNKYITPINKKLILQKKILNTMPLNKIRLQ